MGVICTKKSEKKKYIEFFAFFEKIFKKGIDKPASLWYNI